LLFYPFLCSFLLSHLSMYYILLKIKFESRGKLLKCTDFMTSA
jgi:hypothetical protein